MALPDLIDPDEKNVLRQYYYALAVSHNVTAMSNDSSLHEEEDLFRSRIAKEHEQQIKQFVATINEFRNGNVPLSGDWKDHAGCGLIISENEIQHSTPQQDKSTKNIMLLGIDYSGTKYAKRYHSQLKEAGFINKNEDVIVHSIASDANTRSAEHVMGYHSGNLQKISNEARDIVKKYIIPRLIDENGDYKPGLFTGETPYHVNLIAHSHGCTLAHIVENALREALFIAPEKYGLKTIPPEATARKIMAHTHIIAIGFPLVHPHVDDTWPDIKEIPFCPAFHIVAKDDMLTVRNKSYIGAEIYSAPNFDGKQNLEKDIGKISPYMAFQDEYHPDRVMCILDSGYTKPATNNLIDVLGHSFATYLEGITRPKDDDYRDQPSNGIIGEFLRASLNNSLYFGKFAKERLYAQPYKQKVFEQIVDDNRNFVPSLSLYNPQQENVHWNKRGAHPFLSQFKHFR